jgi:hypothetical protein
MSDTGNKIGKFFNTHFGTIGGLMSSLFSSGVNYFANEANNRANRDLLEMQQRYNTEMWNKENEYNHPAAQMKRLQEAGINPAMAYANGGVSNTASSAPTSPSANAMQPFQMADLGNLISQTKLNESLSNLYDKEADKKEVETEHEYTKIDLTKSMTLEIDSKIPINHQQLKNLEKSFSLLSSQIELNGILGFYYKSAGNVNVADFSLKQLEIMLAKATHKSKVLKAELENKELETLIKYYIQEISIGKVDERLKEQTARLQDEEWKYIPDMLKFDHTSKGLEVHLSQINEKWESNKIWQSVDRLTGALGRFFGASTNWHYGYNSKTTNVIHSRR